MPATFETEVPPGIFSPEWDADIWRYISFYQFVSILQRESLYFNRADRFSDPFEGSLPLPNVREREEAIDEFEEVATSEDIDEISSSAHQSYKKFSFLNCWHMRDKESASMWELYSDQGIAIKSTAKDLKESLEPDAQDFHISEVRYIDYQTEKIDVENTYSPFVHKRESYDNENEIRAIIQDTPDIRPQTESKDEPRGLYVPVGDDVSEEMLVPNKFVDVDLENLISSIYISPSRGKKFEDLVRGLVDREGLDVDVQRSDLDKDPVY